MPDSHCSADSEEGGNGSDDESGMNIRRGVSDHRWSRMTDVTKGWRLRGVEWRVKLGILPGGSATVDAMRRATADGRRRYADVRRRLLVDPHIMDDDQKSSHLRMDNPLSLDPESVWGRYFRNAELEKTIDKDLTRLYPEHGVFFQSAPCQAMMRRILLVWSLIHPQFSYRQGMHELLAPLLYVLHVDVVRLSQVKHRFEDLFDDRFDSLSIQEQHVRDKVELAKNFCGEMIVAGDSINFNENTSTSEDVELDPEEQRVDLSDIVQGSDMYGVEGELGTLLSARFLEHDAYCMLDSLLSGQGGAVVMADFFTSSSGGGKPPVLEASGALYRTLAAADISLYTHLVGLGVEPQFFALRWLRLLFGREFVLEDLLRVWDAILGADNTPLYQHEGEEDSSGMKFSQRSALISSLSVSMLLYVRPALLAAPDQTACLQRLLNFPQVPDVRDLIGSAKSLQLLAQAATKAPGPPVPRNTRTSEIRSGGKHVRSGSISPPTPKHHVLRHQNSNPSSPDVLRVSMSLPGSYWEEKWTHSVLQKKTPEELFSPRSTKSEAVARGFDHVEKEGSNTAGKLLNRSSSEGRHQAVLPEPFAPSLSVKIYDSAHESSDDDGQEMLRRCGGASSMRPFSEDFRADDSVNVSDSDVSHDSDSDGQELKNHSELNREDAMSVASVSALNEEHSCSHTPPHSTFVAGQEGWPKPEAVEAGGTVDTCALLEDDTQESPDSVVRSENSEVVSSSLGNERDGICGTVQPLLDASSNRSTENAPSSIALKESDSPSISAPIREQGRVQDSDLVADVLPTIDVISNESLEMKQESINEGCCDFVPSAALSEKSEAGNKGVDQLEEQQPTNEETSLLPLKAKAPLPPSRLGRFNWMWSLGRSSFVEKTVTNKTSKEESSSSEVIPASSPSTSETDVSGSMTPNNAALRRKKSWWRGNNDIVPEEAVETTSIDLGSPDSGVALVQDDPVKQVCDPTVTTSEVQMKEDVLAEIPVLSQEAVKKPKDMTPSAALQALGQSVLEHVQVLESALAQKVSVLSMETMMWTPAVREKSEAINKSVLGGKGHSAALAALAELRKISQALQQM